MTRGLFVTFEGIDGCGKSTQVEMARGRLEREGRRCVVTREPGGTPIAEKIRALLLSADNGAMVDRCEVLLYLASRAQHVAEKIVPAVRDGAVVLCDRFAEATLAYQGYGRGIPVEQLFELNGFAVSGLAPDLTFVFDIEVDTAAGRMQRMGRPPDRIEGNSREFHERVRRGYLELARLRPDRIKVLDGERPAGEVGDEVWKEISARAAR